MIVCVLDWVIIGGHDGVAEGAPVAVAVGEGVGTLHCPRRIETVFEKTLVTAKSCLPSPLKSPIATEAGPEPTLTLLELLKPPKPSPRRIETVVSLSLSHSWQRPNPACRPH